MVMATANPIVRFPQWEAYLDGFLEKVASRCRHLCYPLIHEGDWDCGMFVCEAILHMTGREVGTRIRCYSDWKLLRRLMGSAAELEVYVFEFMRGIGAELIPVDHARKGDVVLLRLPQIKRAVSIKVGETCAVPGDKGLEYVSASLGICAYRIG